MAKVGGSAAGAPGGGSKGSPPAAPQGGGGASAPADRVQERAASSARTNAKQTNSPVKSAEDEAKVARQPARPKRQEAAPASGGAKPAESRPQSVPGENKPAPPPHELGWVKPHITYSQEDLLRQDLVRYHALERVGIEKLTQVGIGRAGQKAISQDSHATMMQQRVESMPEYATTLRRVQPELFKSLASKETQERVRAEIKVDNMFAASMQNNPYAVGKAKAMEAAAPRQLVKAQELGSSLVKDTAHHGPKLPDPVVVNAQKEAAKTQSRSKGRGM